MAAVHPARYDFALHVSTSLSWDTKQSASLFYTNLHCGYLVGSLSVLFIVQQPEYARSFMH